jgi:hypothetical protein
MESLYAVHVSAFFSDRWKGGGGALSEPIGTNDFEAGSSETLVPIYQLHGVTSLKTTTLVITFLKTYNLRKNMRVHELCEKSNLKSDNKNTS